MQFAQSCWSRAAEPEGRWQPGPPAPPGSPQFPGDLSGAGLAQPCCCTHLHTAAGRQRDGPGSSSLWDGRSRGHSVRGGAGHCCPGFAEGTSTPAANHASSIKSRPPTLGSWAAGCAAAGGCLPAAGAPRRAQQPRHCLGWCQQRWSPAREQREGLVASLQGFCIWEQLELLQDPPPRACAGTQCRPQGGGKGQHCRGLQTPRWGGPPSIPGAPLQRLGNQGCLRARRLGPLGAVQRFLVLGRCPSLPGRVPGGLHGSTVGAPRQAGR